MTQPRGSASGALVVFASRRLGPDRRAWGDAMVAEHLQIPGRWAPWRFAVGCVWASIAVPATPTGRDPRFAASAGAAAALGLGALIFFVSPDTRVFALCFTPMLIVLVWLVLGPWRSSMRSAARATGWAMIAVLAATACCLVLTLYGVARYPGAGRDPWHFSALVFALLLIGYLWVAVAGVGASGSTMSTHRPAGLIAGLALGGLWAAGNVANSSWLSVALLVPAGAVVVLGASAGLSTRRWPSVSRGIWIGLVAGLSAFVLQMTAVYAATRRLTSQSATIHDFHEYGEPFHDITVWLVSDKLGGSIFALALMPVACVLLAALGGVLHNATLRPTASD